MCCGCAAAPPQVLPRPESDRPGAWAFTRQTLELRAGVRNRPVWGCGGPCPLSRWGWTVGMVARPLCSLVGDGAVGAQRPGPRPPVSALCNTLGTRPLGGSLPGGRAEQRLGREGQALGRSGLPSSSWSPGSDG